MAAIDPGYLLDTNILLHAIRGSSTWQDFKAAYDPLMIEPRPTYSVVAEGEIRSIAEQRKWNRVRREQMEFLLGYVRRLDISDADILQSYAAIDSFSLLAGVRMWKNDIWIAATANVTGSVLLTTDRDVEHLHGRFLTRDLIR